MRCCFALVLVVSLAASEAAPACAPSGAVLPVTGGVVRGFDPPAHPYGPGHRGVDLAAPPGALVRVALPGVVTFAGLVAGTGWVTVDHGGGLNTTYGPVAPRFVSPGDPVEAGDVLGLVAVGGQHVDWGARVHGAYVDPLLLLCRWRPHLVRVAHPG